MIFPTKDILVQIPDADLPKLATLYEKNAIWAPYMLGFIHMIIRWKKVPKFCDCLVVTSPNNSWERDGSIIVIMQVERHSSDILVFTLDDHCTNLYEGLMQTQLIDYSRRVLFYAIHEKHMPTVNKYLANLKVPISFNEPGFIYVMAPRDAQNLTTEPLSDVYVAKLAPSMAKQINSVWPHKYPGSEDYLSDYIEINGGYGVFLKSTNELVAWVLKHALNHLGVLQTEEKHKKKGYASLAVKNLAKEIGEEGFCAMASIMVNNKPSTTMFEKIGFTRIGTCNYIKIEQQI